MGWPVSLVKQLTSISEFDLWQAYFLRRQSENDKSDWYAAATIRAIFASQGVPGNKLGQISEYLLKFEPPKKTSKEPQDSKSVWASIFGMDFA